MKRGLGGRKFDWMGQRYLPLEFLGYGNAPRIVDPSGRFRHPTPNADHERRVASAKLDLVAGNAG